MAGMTRADAGAGTDVEPLLSRASAAVRHAAMVLLAEIYVVRSGGTLQLKGYRGVIVLTQDQRIWLTTPTRTRPTGRLPYRGLCAPSTRHLS